MKIFMYLATIATTILTFATPSSVGAQGVLIEPFPSRGYSSNKIYVPSTVPNGIYNNRTTSYERVNPNSYPTNNGSFGSSTTIYDNSGTFDRYRPDPRQTVIFTPQYVNPPSGQSICSTSIVGSPIPSPVTLGSNSQACR
jgi:hypothetical protein